MVNKNREKPAVVRALEYNALGVRSPIELALLRAQATILHTNFMNT